MAEGLANIVGVDLRRRRTVVGLFALSLAVAAFLPQNQRALFGDREMIAAALGVTPTDALRALLGSRVIPPLPNVIKPTNFVPTRLGPVDPVPELEEPSAFAVIADPVAEPPAFLDTPLLEPVPDFTPPRFSDFARLPSALGQPFPTAAVPEPASWAMLLTGFAAMGMMMRRRGGRKSRTFV